MTVAWEPSWYELDQSVVVGDVDLFYLSRDGLSLINGGVTEDDREVKARIEGIAHPELGEVRGIVAIGLDYTIYLPDGTSLLVNAEESPGRLYDPSFAVREWTFQVELAVIQETGRSSAEMTKASSPARHKQRLLERKKRYMALLGLSEAHWDR